MQKKVQYQDRDALRRSKSGALLAVLLCRINHLFLNATISMRPKPEFPKVS